MEINENPIALVDLDGTLANYHGAITEELARLRSPGEPEVSQEHDSEEPWLEARKHLIRSQPGFWRNLQPLPDGFFIYAKLQRLGFNVQILTKGPFRQPGAWSEKVVWCRDHVPGASVTITEDKGNVYGRVLVDDYPKYIEKWLKWRPRGLVIMPDRLWNRGYAHSNVFRYRHDPSCTEGAYDLIARLSSARLRGA